MKNKSSNLADQLFPEVSRSENEILNIPPEQRKLITETYDFAVSTIDDYINNGHMVIPQFQRGYVWNRSQASRLIESLIIQCPIPVIFLAQNTDETLAVIDGNQRLNSINLFLKEDFALQGLTAYPELEGYKFSELDPRFQRHIQNRTIRCIVILKDTHPQIKFDVFERLNTGSVKLNAQELRHGIYHGPLMAIIEKLSKNKMWKGMAGLKADKRMKSDELILRFLSLSEDWRNYQKPMTGFINGFSEKNKSKNKNELADLSTNFTKSVEDCYRIFGDLAFKTFSEGAVKPIFNAALFDAQMVSVNELSFSEKELIILEGKKAKIILGLLKLFHDESFSKYIGQATTDKSAVVNRIRIFRDFIVRFKK
ncbi:DUF262 domain-containing protein [Colwellia sp. BRX10-4]|jgi:L-amino acid N-acyltransferase YncA|uniref:DUF262 domain-containing protein n=1 Tax=Colwellia sp. BRX10-4 TaxID=2759843 RepID=UPI0015F56F77|nr:DUF262 domain-containing protein [Colwellia sp. BRX10-4]MBA6398242.1 DUF262 domain-containing protein [Colwellia sp. BRX10-4]